MCNRPFQPKFLSKQEREAAALARRQQQVEQQKKDLDGLRKKQRDIFDEGRKLLGESAVCGSGWVLGCSVQMLPFDIVFDFCSGW